MPARREVWICAVCKTDACKGGCYYGPKRVIALLARLPHDTQTVTNPSSYGRSRSTVANPMETNWAMRADILRALDAVAAAGEDGPLNRKIVWLAYVGEPTRTPPGRTAGLSDAAIGRKFGMHPGTVASRRMAGLRAMVACLNPDYVWQEEER